MAVTAPPRRFHVETCLLKKLSQGLPTFPCGNAISVAYVCYYTGGWPMTRAAKASRAATWWGSLARPATALADISVCLRHRGPGRAWAGRGWFGIVTNIQALFRCAGKSGAPTRANIICAPFEKGAAGSFPRIVGVRFSCRDCSRLAVPAIVLSQVIIPQLIGTQPNLPQRPIFTGITRAIVGV